MSKKRILAMVLSIAVLVGAAAVSGVVNVGAATTWTYEALERYADISGLGTSLILDKAGNSAPTGSPYNSSPVWTISNQTNDADGGKIDYMTDGSLGAKYVDDSSTKEYTILRDGNTSTWRYVYFDLGGMYDISSFLVATSQYNSENKYNLNKVKIYVATKDTAYSSRVGAFTEGAEDNDYTLVYSHESASSEVLNYHIKATDASTKLGQYVCFAFNTCVSGYGNRIGELAVYGEKYVDWKEATKGSYAAYDRYTELTDIMDEDGANHLLRDLTAYGSPFAADNDSVTDWYYDSSWYSDIPGVDKGDTDGVIGTTAEEAGEHQMVFRDNSSASARYIYYDLGQTMAITDFVVASAQTVSEDYVLKYVKIYVADTAADISTVKGGLATGEPDDGYDLVYENWDSANTAYTYRIQPAGGTVYGRYICFVMNGPYTPGSDRWPIPVGELAAYGAPVNVIHSNSKLESQAKEADDNGVRKLRMLFNLNSRGIVKDNSTHVGDYTNGYVTVGDKEYKIAHDDDGNAIVGTLVSPETKNDGYMNMTLGSTEAYVLNIPAKKIYEAYTSNTEQYGEEAANAVIFTAMITNVDSAHYDTVLYGRPYVAYVDGEGNTRYIYGPVVSTSATAADAAAGN